MIELARHWAGAGSLFEWLRPPEWEIERAWSAEQARARAAQTLLLHLQQTTLPYLPRSPSQWLDLLEQLIYRSQELTPLPTAHTDWMETLSEYGYYPSPSYIDRRPHGTFDTPLTRTLKWFCVAMGRAEALVAQATGQRPLDEQARNQLRFALDLPEVQSAAEVIEVDEQDVAACVDTGGVWALIGTASQRLAGLWAGRAEDQLLSLMPILPEIAAQLFELGTLGAAAMVIRDEALAAAWRTATPLTAGKAGLPCLSATTPAGTWHAYYQTVPRAYRNAQGPYSVLTQELGGGLLRPDLWLLSDVPPGPTELVVECKYSADRGYVAQGMSQVLAYWEEFRPQPEVLRVHMVVGPEAVVDVPKSWGGRVAVGTPADLCALVAGVWRGNAAAVMGAWS